MSSSPVASTSTVSSTTDNPTGTPNNVQNNGLVPEPGSVMGKRKRAKAGNPASKLVTQKKAKFQIIVIPEPESVEMKISPSSTTRNAASQSKRGRKQQMKIKTMQEVIEDVTASSPRPTKGRGTSKERGGKDSSLANAKSAKPSTKKSKAKANVEVATCANMPVPTTKHTIVLCKSFKIDPNLSFTMFPDTTRNIIGIGPLQCVVAAESTSEPGKTADLENCGDVKEVLGTISGLKKHLFVNYLSAPHFIPLKDIWNSAQELTRIVKFSSLESYTGGKQFHSSVNVYRFSGSIYEKLLQHSNPPFQGFPAHTLVIKHPVLKFNTTNFNPLRFPILKRVNYNGHTIAIPKMKIVKLKWSTTRPVDLQIFVEEENFTGKISDVSELIAQNIQPVIDTPNAGLIPVLPTRTSQNVQLTPPDQLYQPFQYVRFKYQTATELFPVEEADFLQPESYNQQQIISQPQDSSHAVAEQVSLLQPAQQQNVNAPPQISRVESQSQQQQFVPSRSPVAGIQSHAATSGQQSGIVRTPPPSQNHSI